MALTMNTKKELKRLGLDQLGITDEKTAQFYINYYADKERAAAWQKEVEEANRQAAANWPKKLTPGAHGVETATGCEFDITDIEGTIITIKVTNREHGATLDDELGDFLERVQHGWIIIRDYTPETMADGILKPNGEGEIYEAHARQHQGDYDSRKEREASEASTTTPRTISDNEHTGNAASVANSPRPTGRSLSSGKEVGNDKVIQHQNPKRSRSILTRHSQSPAIKG